MTLRRSSELRSAIAEWVVEGLLSTDSAKIITDRYDLDGETDWYRNTSFMVGLVASLLVAAGLVLFISENWHHLPIPVRMLTGIMPWVVTAFFTIRFVVLKRSKAAEAWGFLTSLLFGINILLQAQIFHLGGYWPTALMWWAVGSLLLGVALKGPSSVVLAQILALIWIESETSFRHFTPLVFVGVALIALATMRKQTRLTVTGLIAMLCWAIYHAWFTLSVSMPSAVLVMMWIALGFLSIALFEWASPISRRFRDFMILTLSSWIALMALIMSTVDSSNEVWLSSGDWFAAAIAAVSATLLLVKRRDSFAIGLSAIVGWAIVGSVITDDVGHNFAVLGMNVVLFSSGVMLLWSGVKHGRKSDFMSAIMLIVALAFARFLDYFADYTLGAVIFIVAGALLFLANLFWNRRYAKH